MVTEAQLGELWGTTVAKLDLSLEQGTLALHITATDKGVGRHLVCRFTGVRRLTVDRKVGEDWNYAELSTIEAEPARTGSGYSVRLDFWTLADVQLECADIVIAPGTGAP